MINEEFPNVGPWQPHRLSSRHLNVSLSSLAAWHLITHQFTHNGGALNPPALQENLWPTLGQLGLESFEKSQLTGQWQCVVTISGNESNTRKSLQNKYKNGCERWDHLNLEHLQWNYLDINVNLNPDWKTICYPNRELKTNVFLYFHSVLAQWKNSIGGRARVSKQSLMMAPDSEWFPPKKIF